MGDSALGLDRGGSGTASSFGETRWSVVLAAADPRAPGFRSALEELVRSYWRPVRAWIRASFRCTEADAEDLTQAFLTGWIEAGTGRPDPQEGRFRAYLKGALRHFVLNHARFEGAQRRGGHVDHVGLSGEERGSREASPEAAFDAAWRRDLLSAAVGAMRAEYAGEGRPEYGDVFEKYYMATGAAPPTHGELARELGLTPGALNSRLAHARARLRRQLERLVRDAVRDETALAKEMAVLIGLESDS